MAHRIFCDRVGVYQTPAWHGLGTVFPQRVTAMEALAAIGADYTIEERPLYYYSERQGEFVRIDEHKALVREPVDGSPSEHFFSVRGAEYRVLQNADVVKLLDPITQTWPVETIGALGEGEVFFVTLDVGSAAVHGDPVQMYFLVHDNRKQSQTLRLSLTPVRVVCQNTLTMGLKQAEVEVSLTHVSDVIDRAKVNLELMEKAVLARESIVEAMDALASRVLWPEQQREILAAAYPYREAKFSLPDVPLDEIEDMEPTKLADLLGGVSTDAVDMVQETAHRVLGHNDRQERKRQACMSLLHKFNDEFPRFADTAWATVNAVAEYEDWRDGKSERGARQAAIFGDRAYRKQLAFRAALGMVG